MPTAPPSDLLAWLFPGLLAFLCAHVTLECRARLTESLHSAEADRWQWLAGAALAFGSGVWSLHINGLMGMPLAAVVHYHTGLLLAAWLLGVAVAAGGIWASVALGLPALRLGLGALLLGLALVSGESLALRAAGFGLTSRWPLGEMA